MRKLALTFVGFMALASASLSAKTWIGICNDGQNIQYNQTENGNGFLYMKVKDARGSSHTYQIARLKQTFKNSVAICGTVIKNGTGSQGLPITQVCMNRSRKNIYVKYKHPYEANRAIKSGTFCGARVRIR